MRLLFPICRNGCARTSSFSPLEQRGQRTRCPTRSLRVLLFSTPWWYYFDDNLAHGSTEVHNCYHSGGQMTRHRLRGRLSKSTEPRKVVLGLSLAMCSPPCVLCFQNFSFDIGRKHTSYINDVMVIHDAAYSPHETYTRIVLRTDLTALSLRCIRYLRKYPWSCMLIFSMFNR